MFIILSVAKTFYKMSSINSGTQQPCVADELAEVLNAIELAAARARLAAVQAATELAEVQSATELAAANELVEVFPTVELAVVHADDANETVNEIASTRSELTATAAYETELLQAEMRRAINDAYEAELLAAVNESNEANEEEDTEPEQVSLPAPDTVLIMPTTAPEEPEEPEELEDVVDEVDDDFAATYQYNTVSMGSDYSGNYGGHNVRISGNRCSSLQYMSFEGQCCSSSCLGTGDYCECDYRDYEPVDSYDDDEINELCLFLDTGHTYDVHFDFYFHYSSIPLELTNLFNIVKSSSCDRDNQLWTYKGRGLTWLAREHGLHGENETFVACLLGLEHLGGTRGDFVNIYTLFMLQLLENYTYN